MLLTWFTPVVVVDVLDCVGLKKPSSAPPGQHPLQTIENDFSVELNLV